MSSLSSKLSRRARGLGSSPIREMLKIVNRPGMISFAGGLPEQSTFPSAALEKACRRVLREAPGEALQYSSTEGFLPLREWIAERCSAGGTRIGAEQVLITSGSQQGLDLIGKILIDQGTPVLVERPTYVGALHALSLYEPRFVGVASDEQGPVAADLAAADPAAAFFYVVPNFQNPTGLQIGAKRRAALVAAAAERDLLIVEDDPYGDLSFTDSHPPTLLSLDPERVVYLGSFSKILAPGMRLGYTIAPAPLYPKLVQAKQAGDLHTASFSQRVVYSVLTSGMLDRHIADIRALYSARCRAMLDALEAHFPAAASWQAPQGGMFVWVTLPEFVDSRELLERAVEAKVAFLPGAPFYAYDPAPNTMRLSFVCAEPATIEAGIRVLGQILHEYLLQHETRGEHVK